MIDLENDIFDYVAKTLRTAHSGIDVTGEYVEQPAKFPHVSILESDNRVLQRMRTADDLESGASVMYEVSIFSNKPGIRKSEAKSIANTVDSAFEAINFTRTFRQQVPNLKDSTVYRIVCRYEAVVDKNFVIYFND